MDSKKLIKKIDRCLPQTQCRQCSYPSCWAYAQAIVENNECIDRCVPGGIKTLTQLGQCLNQEINQFISRPTEEPKTQIAQIREDECIGCTKCLQACPIDAIVGAPKQMHTILSNECTGCGLCIDPCPVDCIDLIEQPLHYQPEKARQRFQARTVRLEHKEKPLISQDLHQKRSYIQAALHRVQQKKLSFTQK